MRQYEVSVTSGELLASWRAATHRLFIDVAGEAPRLHDPVAARIRLLDRSMVTTVLGSAVSAHRHGQLHRVELSPSEAGLAAVAMLTSAARGERVAYQVRAPRYLARLPLVVATDGGEQLMTTFSVSARGCGITWSGPPPVIGRRLRLRLGPMSRRTDVWGVVRWAGAAGRGVTAGIGLIQDAPPPPAWADLFDSAARSGAPRA